MKILESVFEVNNYPIEFPLDLINPKYGTANGFCWHDGEFKRSNHNYKIVAEWNNIKNYNIENIIRCAEDLNFKELYIGKNISETIFFAVGFC